MEDWENISLEELITFDEIELISLDGKEKNKAYLLVSPEIINGKKMECMYFKGKKFYFDQRSFLPEYVKGYLTIAGVRYKIISVKGEIKPKNEFIKLVYNNHAENNANKNDAKILK